ncbi:TIGR02594 family protein [Caballeronia sp. INML2]|jgi:uncharacterized protein (TIGR02594 family)|uniref:TIGR02594 family protein n=1 Tax=Caballeronia sp. INML2 TaxID=2921748 RepID=UPI0020281532|nr:TIGR02594 family protein [Caballeronia sp. INML2]
MQRRNWLKGMAAGVLAHAVLTRESGAVPEQIGSTQPTEFPEGKRVPTVQEILDSMPRFQGTKPAYMEEVEKGKAIVAGCVSGVSPLEVAQYFEQLRTGAFDDQFGADSSLYAQEWPIRANPVIVGFFDATTYRTPAGDQTAWCAAFVNWCVSQANKSNRATASAASSSFRNWGTETDTPVAGDIVVFKHKRESDKGHVAFFVGKAANGVVVLGGNQMPLTRRLPGGTYEVRNTGEVNTKVFPLVGKDLDFHSFRTHPVLHG